MAGLKINSVAIVFGAALALTFLSGAESQPTNKSTRSTVLPHRKVQLAQANGVTTTAASELPKVKPAQAKSDDTEAVDETKLQEKDANDTGDDGTVKRYNDLEIGKIGARTLHADVITPSNIDPSKPLPGILFLHPGGFVSGSYKEVPCVFLARHGYVIVSAEYRFSNEAPFPAQIEDAMLAVRWMRANAKQYNIDPKRIAAWGSSAGGQLAQSLGTMRHTDGIKIAGGCDKEDDSVQAVVSFFGSSDATLGHKLGKVSANDKLHDQLHGCSYKDNPEKWKRDSAITYVRPEDPPFFLVTGELDKIVIAEQGEEMGKALTQAKVPNEVIIVKNASHMFEHKKDAPADPPYSQVKRRAVEFLDHYLKAK